MADPEVWRALLETGNPYVQQERQQKGLMGMMLLQEKQREMEDTQRLRDLYSSGQPVRNEQLMAIDPKFGVEMQKAGNQAYLQQLQAQDLINKQNEYQSKTYAQYMGPLADTYFDDIRSGMRPEMALEKFRSAVGSSQKELEEKHGIRPQADFTQFSPEQVLDRTTGLGVPSRHYKNIEEQQKSNFAIQQKLMPGPSDRYFIGPDGLPHPNPYFQPQGGGMSTRGGQGPYSEEAPYQFTMPSGQKIKVWDLGSAAQALQGIPEGPDREAASKWLDEQWSGMRNPEKVKTKQELEVETAAAKKKAELSIEEQAASKKATNAYEMLPSPDRIRNLIKGSISGDVEYWANRLGGTVGKSLEAGDMTGALKVIEGQMADTVAMFPGAQSDKELEARMKTIGDPSAKISPDTRLAAFNEWLERMQKYASQHAEYDDTQLLDMVKDGKLNADQAMKIRKRRMSGSL
jgi:hypothetical protein